MKHLLMSSHVKYVFVMGLVVALLIGPASSPISAVPKPQEPPLTVSISQPANGTFFSAGEQPTITVNLGKNFEPGDFATLNLYLYGPQDQSKTTTAVAMLNASSNRSTRPHHYIDLLTHPDVQTNGNLLSYTLQPVTTEEPGTYTASVWAVLATDSLVQTMQLADLQIGTATAETQVVEKFRCATCHEGASNGKMYLHHIDPSSPTSKGNWSLDFVPVRTCKSCHNQEGYAAYTNASGVKTADPIVRRVHGVHMGEGLKDPFNTNPDTGSFKNYLSVVFPADIKNCTYCHVDDRWKTKPSRGACGACHDNIWFGDPGVTPTGWENHLGGQQSDDTGCSTCHPADNGGVMPVAEAHQVPPPAMNGAVVTMTPPRNEIYYVAGDKPRVTIVIKDDSGNPIADHTTVDNTNFSTAGLFVYGPRRHSKPVLTSTAKNGNSKYRASVSNTKAASGTPKGWTFEDGNTFKIAVNGNPPVVLAAPVGLQTPDNVRDWLIANLSDVTITSNNTAGTVSLKSNLQGENSKFEIYNSEVTSIMGWKPGGLPLDRGGNTSGVTMEPYVIIGQSSYAINDLRKLSDPLDYSDPRVTRNVENITYQLNDVAGLRSGTYMVYVWVQPISGKIAGLSRPTIGFMMFQIGTEKEDRKLASNCRSCHGNTIMHLTEGPQHPAPFDPDYCKACHDYSRSGTGDGFARLGGTSTSGWSGFGAVPIVRRAHGLHFGRYLNRPEEIYAGNPNAFNEVIFPQDVRNCTKCHIESTSWKKKPSPLACLSCHDAKETLYHASQWIKDPTPLDPWSGDETLKCLDCHGLEGVKPIPAAHKITNPYRPPYERDPLP